MEALRDCDYELEEMPDGKFVGDVYTKTHEIIKALNSGDNRNDCFMASESVLRDFVWNECRRAIAATDDKKILKQAAKALLVFNDMCAPCWDAKEYYDLKQIVHNALDEIKEIMSPELLELLRQERKT